MKRFDVFSVSRNSYKQLNLSDRIFPNWIVSFVLEGKVMTGSHGEQYEARAGDVMIHPPDVAFFERSSQAGTHCWMSLNVNDEYNLDYFEIHPLPLVLSIHQPDEYEAIFNVLLSRWNQKEGSFKKLSVLASVMNVVTMIMESWERSGCPERSSKLRSRQSRFTPLIHYMSLHLDQKLTRAKLANQVHLNSNYLDRAFYDVYGVTPMQMLREIRLEKVKALLETTNESLASISQAAGLGDAAYLSRLFNKSFDMTPGRYREYLQSAKENYMK